MYERELLYRKQFQYPPFTRLVEITLRHKEVQAVEKAALFLVNEARKHKNALILGPSIPFISKVNNNYIREVLIKTTAQTPGLPALKDSIREVLDKMKGVAEFKSVSISVDVDPL